MPPPHISHHLYCHCSLNSPHTEADGAKDTCPSPAGEQPPSLSFSLSDYVKEKVSVGANMSLMPTSLSSQREQTLKQATNLVRI